MSEKRNCWEIKGCGCEPGGKLSKTLGVCIAARPGEGNGINGGQQRGRICWAIPGTLCSEVDKATGIKDVETCFDCTVFKAIYCEERDEIVMLLRD